MLRITVFDMPNRCSIKLEGKLAGPWVAELDSTWRSLFPTLHSRPLQLDLRGVLFADETGRSLLQQIYNQKRAEFLTDSPLTQYFAEEAMKKSLIPLEKGV
jgi:hypothetical protein